MKCLTITPASLTHRHVLELAGVRCEVQTNSSQLKSTLEQWLSSSDEPGPCELSMQILVGGNRRGFSQDGHFRGLHHLVVASFGSDSIFVFDLLRRNIWATVPDETACDRMFWNDILLPIAIGVVGTMVGVLPVHCACLALEGRGLVMAGISGAGKSTLTAALAHAGFDYISDDWTYFNQRCGTLTAHGMAARLKLLPDTVSHFPDLSRHLVSPSLNGELAYQVTADVFGSKTRPFCEPRWGIFLERTSRSGCQFTPTSATQAREYLNSSVERLPAQLDEIAQCRANIMDRIASLPWWHFRYGGTPQFAAQQLHSFVSQKQMAAV